MKYEQLLTIAKKCLEDYMGRVTSTEMQHVEEGIH